MTMERGRGNLRKFWVEQFPQTTMVAGSRDCVLSSLGTLRVTGAKTLAANGAPESINLFQVSSVVTVLELYGIVTTGTGTGLTAAYFDLYDGTAALDLTKNDGNITSLGIDSFLAKTAAAATTMSVKNSTAGFFDEPATGVRQFQNFTVGQKVGVATYIRFTYTKDAGAATGAIQFYCRYHCKRDSASIVAV